MRHHVMLSVKQCCSIWHELGSACIKDEYKIQIAYTISKKLEARECIFVDTHLNWSVLGKEMLVEVSRCLAVTTCVQMFWWKLLVKGSSL